MLLAVSWHTINSTLPSFLPVLFAAPRGIKYSILTGQTKADTRIEMVDEFNKDDNIKVFLISLKAGGTGLNLTGADMVIHYDPWWNVVKNMEKKLLEIKNLL